MFNCFAYVLGKSSLLKSIIDCVHLLENNQLISQNPHASEIDAEEYVVVIDSDEDIYKERAFNVTARKTMTGKTSRLYAPCCTKGLRQLDWFKNKSFKILLIYGIDSSKIYG